MKPVTLAALYLFISSLTFAEEQNKTYQSIDKAIEQMMLEYKTPGVALALTNREKLLHVSVHGVSNLGSRTSVTGKTLFGIGSIGKSFTAVAILQLLDSGKLDVQAPVSQYLPWFKVNSTVPITPHHLMTHTSGFPNMRMELMSSLYQAFWLTDSSLNFVPGKYHYSSAAWDVLSSMIQELSGRPYAQFILENILRPLEMMNSEPAFRNAMRPKLSISYEPVFDDRPTEPDMPLVESNWYEYGGGAGSPASTAEDLARYLRMFLNRGRGPNGRILSERSFSLITQHAVKRAENRFYGYGLEIVEEEGHTLVGHGGGTQGFRSMMLGDLDDGLGVVAFANGPADLNTVCQFVLKAARANLHQKELPPLPQTSDPTKVPSGKDYAGTYRTSNGRLFKVEARDDKLTLEINGQTALLQKRGNDLFFCKQPELGLYLLQFARSGQQIVEAFHGSDWYVNEHYQGPTRFEYPSEWNAYPGHYRTSTRHHINFRIVLRKGKLGFVTPEGRETPLVPVKDSLFQVGDSPEWLRFETQLNGRTLQVTYSGTAYHRDFTE